MVGRFRRFVRNWFLPNRLKTALPEEVLEASNHLARLAPPSSFVSEPHPVLKTARFATHALDWFYRLKSSSRGTVSETPNLTTGVFREKIGAGKVNHKVTLGHSVDLGTNEVESNIMGGIESEISLGGAVAKAGLFRGVKHPAGIAINRVSQLIAPNESTQTLHWNERVKGLTLDQLRHTVEIVKRELATAHGPDLNNGFQVRDSAGGSATVHYTNARGEEIEVGRVEKHGLTLLLGHPKQYSPVRETLIRAVFAKST